MRSMGWRSSLALLLALLLAPSCRLHVMRVELGGAWTPAAAEALPVQGADRGAVLAALGPPDVVTYTLSEEVLLYRRVGHRGSDLRFLLPDPGFNLGRPGLEELSPELDAPEDLSGEAPPIVLMRLVLDTLFGLLNPASAEDAVALHARRLRWDAVRVVVDRATLDVRSVEVYRGIDGTDAARLARGALLLGDG